MAYGDSSNASRSELTWSCGSVCGPRTSTKYRSSRTALAVNIQPYLPAYIVRSLCEIIYLCTEIWYVFLFFRDGSSGSFLSGNDCCSLIWFFSPPYPPQLKGLDKTDRELVRKRKKNLKGAGLLAELSLVMYLGTPCSKEIKLPAWQHSYQR